MENIKFEVIKKIAETNFKIKNLGDISQLNSNSPPSVFVGSRLKYPLVNIGILSPLERDKNAWVYDDAKYWADNNFQIKDVLNLRNSLLNSRFQSKAHDARLNKKFVEIAKEIAVASRPVDVEIELKYRMRFRKDKDKILTPHGMNAGLKKARIISNVKIDRKLDKMMNDEIKAHEGVVYLYQNQFNEYALSKILSVGVLGMKKNKKLVPTRWSITATDDILGKNLLKKVREYPLVDDFGLFAGEFLGNQYLILIFPYVWNFELFELYLPESSWNPSNEIKAATDFEGYSGRKNYAFNTAGGYYATRFPILEYLNKIKRQGSVLVIRIETPSYWAGLGVWVVRESVKKTLANEKIKFSDRKKFLESAVETCKIRYNFDCSEMLRRSKLIEQINSQRNLREWF